MTFKKTLISREIHKEFFEITDSISSSDMSELNYAKYIVNENSLPEETADRFASFEIYDAKTYCWM